MSQQCDVCGKRPMVGNNVSHSKVHTRRRFMPNLHTTRITKAGHQVRALVCTRCIRTMSKAPR